MTVLSALNVHLFFLVGSLERPLPHSQRPLEAGTAHHSDHRGKLNPCRGRLATKDLKWRAQHRIVRADQLVNPHGLPRIVMSSPCLFLMSVNARRTRAPSHNTPQVRNSVNPRYGSII